jgi:hypothetical protein
MAAPDGDKTRAKTPRNAPWKPGQSGNPKGCPKGSRHKTTLAVEALLDGQAERLTQKAVEMAKRNASPRRPSRWRSRAT